MMHQRYGNLREIWRRTGGNCHHCHGAVDLFTYGLVGVYGGRTATIDHLPAPGVEVQPEHLRMAHLSCNTRRGAPRAEPPRVFVSGEIGEIGERRAPIAVRPVDEHAEQRRSLNRALIVTIACAVATVIVAVAA